MAIVKARYTKSLDLVALAFKEQRKGNSKNAAHLFAAAAAHPSANYAMSVIEATNSRSAPAKTTTTAKSAKVKAKRRVQAESEEIFEDTDDDTLEVLESLTDEDLDVEEDVEDDLDEDADEDDDDDGDLDAEEDEISDIVEGRARARMFAASLQSMARRGRNRG